jgi:glycogen synthase
VLDRVLMTTDTVGGVFTYAVTLSRELAMRGIDVHLATMGPLPKAEQRALARTIPRLVLHESTYALEWMPDPWDDVARAGTWLQEIAAEVRPQVVHLNGYAHGALSFDAPKVVVAHSCVLSWWRAVLAEAAPPRYETYAREVMAGLRGADQVIAISHAMLASLEEHYGELPGARVVHNGTKRARPVEKEPGVLACGRLWDRAKNIEALVRIAPRLSCPVRIAGWEDEQPLGANVEALGWLDPSTLADRMARAAIFALPARYEPFGLSALEAAMRGAALVLGDLPSQREIWDNAAIYVAPDDDDALACALVRLSTDSVLRHEFARRARRRALHFGADRMGEAMIEIYRLLLERGARACA